MTFFVKGSDTSEEAANSIAKKAPSMRTLVLAEIKNAGDSGLTDAEIESVLRMRHQTASARRRELVLAGLVIDSGERRVGASGRKAAVWVWSKSSAGLLSATRRRSETSDTQVSRAIHLILKAGIDLSGFSDAVLKKAIVAAKQKQSLPIPPKGQLSIFDNTAFVGGGALGTITAEQVTELISSPEK